MPSAPKKTATAIIDSHNDYIGALKGNQSGLLAAVVANFQPQATTQQINRPLAKVGGRNCFCAPLILLTLMNLYEKIKL